MKKNNMRYFRLGHLETILVKVGDKVKNNQLIGTNGTGNGQYPAHCHSDGLRYKPAKWTEYPIGKSTGWVEEHYFDVTEFAKKIMPSFNHFGLEWLEYWDYESQSKKVKGAKKPCFHPGVDLNGKGAGNSDLGDKLYSPCDGEVVYCYNGKGSNSGWGKLLVIKEHDNVDKTMDVEVTYETVKNSKYYKELWDSREIIKEKLSKKEKENSDLDILVDKFQDENELLTERNKTLVEENEKLKNKLDVEINREDNKITQKQMTIIQALDGRKTYVGIALSLIAAFNLTDYISPEEVQGIVDGVCACIGAGMTVIGIAHKIYKKFKK